MKSIETKNPNPTNTSSRAALLALLSVLTLSGCTRPQPLEEVPGAITPKIQTLLTQFGEDCRALLAYEMNGFSTDTKELTLQLETDPQFRELEKDEATFWALNENGGLTHEQQKKWDDVRTKLATYTTKIIKTRAQLTRGKEVDESSTLKETAEKIKEDLQANGSRVIGNLRCNTELARAHGTDPVSNNLLVSPQ